MSQGGAGAVGGKIQSADDEDKDDTNSSNTSSQEVEDLLTNFREKWQKELKIAPKLSQSNVPNESKQNKEDDIEQQAKLWYLRGSENERAGKLYEAITCYKRAVQLVPDIEFKISQKILLSPRQEEGSDDDDTDVEENYLEYNDEPSDSEDLTVTGTILSRIQKKMSRCQYFCISEYEQRAMHISALPTEILLYIFKWVVSSELDLRSLEMCSMVSRGFYLCARDQEIWRLACIRAWGVNCGNLSSTYPNWREMFVERSRLHYNGCYISKTTYIRHGENSFQDQFYRPWHLVAYYRYLRFFPDGQVLMLTTADEPRLCVSLLKHRSVKQSAILIGHYRLKDDRVSIVVQQQDYARPSVMYKRVRRRNEVIESDKQSFHLELQIQNYNKRRHVQLMWVGYSVFTQNKNGVENKASFEMANNRFPPLWFSRVKSYTRESYSPLQ